MAQFQNSQRQVVNTIEEANKYQTGNSRRLRVSSDPLTIPVAANVSDMGQLATALGSIKPALMDWGVDKMTEANVKEINLGKNAAQTGSDPTGEMQQYGYDKVKSINDWTDWQTKAVQNYEQTFDKSTGNIDDFLKQQWEAQPFQDKSSTYIDNFTALAGKTMGKIRESQGVFAAEQQNLQNNTELTRTFYHDIGDVMGSKDALGNPNDYTTAHYEQRRADLKAHFPGKTNSQLDELAHNAVFQKAQETNDVSLYKIFKTPHADGTPGLYEIPAWKTKIDNEVHQILAQKNTDRNDLETRSEKALKNAADTKERGYYFELIAANEQADPIEKDKKIAAIIANAKEATEMGLPLSDGFLNKLMVASSRVNKEEETAYQSQNYNKFRIGNPTVREIANARTSNDISQAGFEKLMNANDAEATRAIARAERGDKPLITNAWYKDAQKQIMSNAGYSFGNFEPANVQAKANAEAVMATVRPYIEDLVENQGMSIKEASAKGAELGIKNLHDAGLQNKLLDTAQDKLGMAKLKVTDPSAYYQNNLEDYLKDSTAKTLPPMDARSTLILQRKALALHKSNKLKTHESTR